jgi:hypothetical protein
MSNNNNNNNTDNDIFFTITKYLIDRNFTIKEFNNMVFKYILYEMPLLENISLDQLNNIIKSYFTENKIDEQYIINMVKSMIKKYRRDISVEDLLNSSYQFGYNFDAINGIEAKVVSKIASKIYNMIISKENKEGTKENIIDEKLELLFKKIESQNATINQLASDLNYKNKVLLKQNNKINNLIDEVQSLKAKQIELENKINKTIQPKITVIPTAQMTSSPSPSSSPSPTHMSDEIDVDVEGVDDVEMEKEIPEPEINPPDFSKLFSQFETLGKTMAINFIKSIKIDK